MTSVLGASANSGFVRHARAGCGHPSRPSSGSGRARKHESRTKGNADSEYHGADSGPTGSPEFPAPVDKLLLHHDDGASSYCIDTAIYGGRYFEPLAIGVDAVVRDGGRPVSGV